MFEDAEIKDGDQVFPRNQPCKICTCRKGVISCEDQPCNCSTWKGGSGRDICCPQCNPKWVNLAITFLNKILTDENVIV